MYRSTLTRRLALALAALCALLIPLTALSEEAQAEAIVASAIEDDGVLRVYLRSLGAPSQLTLTLDGAYTVEHDAGFRFERGTSISLSDGGDRVWMRVGGLTLDMGSSLTLTRQAAEEGEENGLRISESGGDNLFAGDLSVTLAEGGGLRAVLSIGIEDYLCGVVAYEMSNSWPLEALKAQAVAARTYAMQRKWSAGTRDYDLVDTTADQVFRGYDESYTNVIEAVRATEGVVGTWNGGFATCYYTASNGGETALPSDVWGDGGDYGYLERRADPYDLENPDSMVASASFSPAAGDLPALESMLMEGLEAAVAERGLSAEELRIEEILSIEPADPVAEGSIVCRTLRFTLSASALVPALAPGEGDIGAPRAADENAHANLALYSIDLLRRLRLGSPYVESLQRETFEETFEVDLSVYDQIKDGLGLSLNGSDYEVASVREEVFGYAIEMRRFGHGVGMSQRGAQYMADPYGMVYEEILRFYYPGMTLERISWQEAPLESLEELPESVGRARPDPTPTPAPAPLPELEEGEYYARVTLSDSSSSMNLRQQPGTQSQVVTQLDNNQRVIVCGEADAEGWVPIRTAEFSGYARLEYLTEE